MAHTGITLDLKIDPRDLQINQRYRGSHALPAKARKAHQRICEAVGDYLRRVPDYEPCQRCEVWLGFWFPNRRSDTDGPIKRTLDGFERGLKDWGIEFNDNRVEVLHVHRYVGDTPKISITMIPWNEE